MANIIIDYEDTLRKADQLDDLARRLKNICKKDLQGIINTSGANWHGETSAVQRKKLTAMYNKTLKQAANLQATADTLRRRANFYKYIETTFGGKR